MLYSLLVAFDDKYLIKRRNDFRYYETIKGVEIYIACSAYMRRWFEDENTIAFTHGVRIYAKSARALKKHIIRHEMAHIRQAKKAGVLYSTGYTFQNWWNGYEFNSYEVAARKSERRR